MRLGTIKTIQIILVITQLHMCVIITLHAVVSCITYPYPLLTFINSLSKHLSPVFVVWLQPDYRICIHHDSSNGFSKKIKQIVVFGIEFRVVDRKLSKSLFRI